MNNINEFIDKNMDFIKGTEKEFDLNSVSTNKTGDELKPMVTRPADIYSMGYAIRENDAVLPKKIYDQHDVLDADNEVGELPNIYSIENINLVNKLKTLITLVNKEDKESDKVAILADFIKNVNVRDISPKYKKEILKLLKEKL
jgi:S-adenosylmethionine synthetase